DGFYVAAAGASANHCLAHIRSVVQDHKFNVSIADESENMGMLSIQGPKSRQILQSLTDTDLSDASFPFSTTKVINFAGHKVRAIRLTFVGEMGWELHIPSASSWRRATSTGTPTCAWRTPRWKAGLGFTCKLKSDVDFLGRTALERQKADGLRKRIACFTLDEDVALHGLEAIWRDDEVVGFTRRGEYGFALGKSLAYGYVKRPDGAPVSADYLSSGNYWLESLGRRFKATFHAKVPFDPTNKRVKGVYDEPLPCDSRP
ncbi:hypothetical protein MTO96_025147, partial [Rhipicephalus appendiculatus]